MNFQDAVKTCFQKYATFSGRAARSEYWFFVLFNLLLSMVLGIADAAAFSHVDPLTGKMVQTQVLGNIAALITLLPSLAVAVRRLHDLGKSGWFVLINLIPIIGWIIFIVWAATKGTTGENRFGGDPLAAAA